MVQNYPKGIIRWKGLKKLFNDDISRGTIDRWIKDKKFPAKIQLGKNLIGWRYEAVE